jgi:hypothetical protein
MKGGYTARDSNQTEGPQRDKLSVQPRKERCQRDGPSSPGVPIVTHCLGTRQCLSRHLILGLMKSETFHILPYIVPFIVQAGLCLLLYPTMLNATHPRTLCKTEFHDPVGIQNKNEAKYRMPNGLPFQDQCYAKSMPMLTWCIQPLPSNSSRQCA